jgi:hypothetical protein
MYKKTISGDWPAGGHAFAIVPYHTDASGTIVLPMGTMTNKMTDLDTGSVQEVVQALVMKGMKEDDAKKLADPDNWGVIATSLAAAADASLKLKAANILITSAKAVKSSRRLGEDGAPARKLADWQLDVTYKVLLAQGLTWTDKTIDATKMATEVTKNAKAAGLGDVKVGTITVSKGTVVEVGGTGTDPTGAARPMCGSIFTSFLALAVALTAQRLLA